MKVALLIDSLVRGGAERQVLYTFEELRRRGTDIRIIYYHQCANEFQVSADDSDRLVLLPKSGRPFRFILQLRRYFKLERFDIVHAFKDTPCFYGCLATWRGPTKVFIAGHRTQGLPTGKFRHALALVNRLCTAWIGNSRAISRSLTEGLETSPAKIFTVYNGIDPAAFKSSFQRDEAKARLGLSRDQLVVSIIAVIRPEKNHAMFIRMAAQVHKQIPRAIFLITGCPVAGDSVSQPALENLARELNVLPQIRFLGMRDDVPDILAATDVLALTSHLEGMSNALLESMSAEVPFVTTNYAGVDELTRDGDEGFIVPLNDDVTMSQKVIQLLSDHELRRRMGASGHATVTRRFSIQAMGDSLLSIYQRLLENAGHRNRISAS
jgi:glycosyltransferase involved in cell wall biosynthesis